MARRGIVNWLHHYCGFRVGRLCHKSVSGDCFGGCVRLVLPPHTNAVMLIVCRGGGTDRCWWLATIKCNNINRWCGLQKKEGLFMMQTSLLLCSNEPCLLSKRASFLNIVVRCFSELCIMALNARAGSRAQCCRFAWVIVGGRASRLDNNWQKRYWLSFVLQFFLFYAVEPDARPPAVCT